MRDRGITAPGARVTNPNPGVIVTPPLNRQSG